MNDILVIILCGSVLLIIGLAHLAFWICIAVGALRVGKAVDNLANMATKDKTETHP